MLNDMEKIKFVTMFSGYIPENRFCKQKDTVSRTVQDAVVDVLGLFEQFAGHLPDLFNQYDNGLLFESLTGTGVFIDELNADEVKRYNQFLADKHAAEEKAALDAQIFEDWKVERAAEIARKREEASASPEQKEEPKS